MDSFILRIYQRFQAGARRMVGILETPDGNTRYVLRNAEELWRILQMKSAIEDETAVDSPRHQYE